MDDNDNILWFICGYLAGNDKRDRIRPRDKWDVAVYVFFAACFIVALAISVR